MKLTFYGGAKVVTGSNYLLESGDTKILIDCGLLQSGFYCDKSNFDPFPYDPKKIQAVFITHTHIDHTGRIPKLFKEGFRGKVYSTPPTREAAYYLLADSENILQRDAEHFKTPPLYTRDDLEFSMKYWDGLEYHAPVHIGPFTVTLFDSAHILGSAFIQVVVDGKKIIFSGDLGNSPTPLLGYKELLPTDADYCLIESTYGGRIHENVAERKDMIEDWIEDTAAKRGVLLIPAFAMERTQELLYEINDLVDHKRIPPVPIFLDSPLAIKLTEVYKKFQSYFVQEAQDMIKIGESLFTFPGLKISETKEDSIAINKVPPPKVIIAGAGMLNGGRILHHALQYLPDPKTTLRIIGYQAKGSLGRRLLDGEKIVKILGKEILVNAEIKAIGGYSAHADQPQLLAWLAPVRQSLKKVFVVQGEEDQAEALKLKIKDDLAIEAVIPEGGEVAEL